ncbi:MAG: diacylglycerol kinase family protein [Bacteroidota bacterium]
MKNKFKPAFLGIKDLIKHDYSIKIHLVIALVVCAAGWFFNISVTEWLVVILCIGIVLIAEAFNSAIEKLCDLEDTNFNFRIKPIKDISASGVLIAAIVSVIAGLIIFLPKILTMLGSFF